MLTIGDQVAGREEVTRRESVGVGHHLDELASTLLAGPWNSVGLPQ